MEKQTPLIGQTLGEFGAALASEQATPGGGAAAAVSASLAASLTSMVVRLSIGRPRYQEHAGLLADALEASDAARLRLLELADEDARAYAAYRAARALPHDSAASEAAREEATRTALRAATAVPLSIVRSCHAQAELVHRLAGRTNASLASDLEVAALLLEGAARGAAANVAVNLAAIGDEGYVDAVRAELDQRLQQIQVATDRTREQIATGAPRKPEDA